MSQFLCIVGRPVGRSGLGVGAHFCPLPWKGTESALKAKTKQTPALEGMRQLLKTRSTEPTQLIGLMIKSRLHTVLVGVCTSSKGVAHDDTPVQN